MAQQVINIGTAPNDGTGDQLRTAFDKCNDNFTELYAGGPGGGAVDSVNGQTGDVVLDATDLDALQRNGSNANSNIDIGEYELKAGQFTLDTSPTGTAAVGTTRWNNTLGSAETTLKGGSVILKNGVDLVARVVNKVTPNATLTKAAYQAVRVSGAQGQRLAVAYAQANNDNNSADTIGLVCETIATNQEGFIITVGQLEGINTTGSLQGETWADGDVIYLSPTTPGVLTKVKPTAPGHIVIIGYVEYAHAINGKLYVKIMNGWELDELHNVNISSPTNNQILAYTLSTQLWENKSVATALGYTPSNLTTTPRILANDESLITSTGTETVCATIQIDNLGTNWAMDLFLDMVKSGTTSVMQSKIYINNTANLSGTPTQIAVSAADITTRRVTPLFRKANYKGGIFKIGNSTLNFQNDLQSQNSAKTEVTIDLNTAQARFLVFTVQRIGAAGDTVTAGRHQVIFYPNV
jgi:nitrogen fixation protein